MKKIFAAVLVIAAFSLATACSGDMHRDSSAIELGEIVKAFMLPASLPTDSLLPWDTQSENPKIVWQTHGTSPMGQRAGSPKAPVLPCTLMRNAHINIQVMGKQFYALETRKQGRPLELSLLGDNEGVIYTEISPPMGSAKPGGSGADYDFEATLAKAKVSFSKACTYQNKGEKASLYILEAEGKKDTWAVAFEFDKEQTRPNHIILFYWLKGLEKNQESYRLIMESLFAWAAPEDLQEIPTN